MRAKGDGDCVGRLDDGGGENQEVGDVGKDIAEYDERERGVDNAGKVAGGVLEFSCDIVDLGVLVDMSRCVEEVVNLHCPSHQMPTVRHIARRPNY